MIDKRLLDLLVCPQDHTPLQVADEAVMERVNRAIAQGRVLNHGGQPVEKPIDGGLIREDQKLLYPVVDGIPVLLVDEAILLSSLE